VSEKNWKTRLLTSSVFAGAMFATAALPAIAQTEDEPVATTAPAAEEPAVKEKITVTGSRLALQDFQSISPVTSVTSEAIELNATLTVETLLNELPQVIPGNTVTSNNAGGEDFATIDLRGLGPQRTLVLIDGERVPGSSTTGVVDLNSIPAGLIDRIEVVTGGASAVYGSDALAGVVNFILKDDYEGAQVTVGGGGGFDGNAQYETADFLFGGNFDNGRGNLVTYASYFNRDGVKQSQYDYSRVSGSVVYGYTPGVGYADRAFLVDSTQDYLNARAAITALGFAPRTFSGGSGTPPWGSISSNAANPFQNLSTNPFTAAQFAAADTDCNPSTPGVVVNGGGLSFNDQGQLTPFFGGNSATGTCGTPIRANGSSRYSFAPDNFIYLPAERWGIQTFGNYDVTDTIRMKTSLSYVRSQANVQLAATPTTGISVNPNTAPSIVGADGIIGTADDPHRDLSAALLSRPSMADANLLNDNFTYAWRSNAVGPRAGEFVNSQLLGRVTFEGEITDNWDWNLSAGWGQGRFSQGLENNVNLVALNQGLGGCANIPAASRLPNCVNVDIFGPNALTPAAASFIRTNISANQVIEQTSLSGYVRGDLFDLPAGGIATVVGFEYRDDDVAFAADDAQRRGEISGFNAVQDINGALDVYEAYAEVAVPLLADMPLAQELSLEAGYRVSDYSTIGSVDSYKYGLRYAPVDWLNVRAVFNKAVRAPSAIESFQNGDQGFPAYTDPCRATVAAGNPTLTAFCTTNGNIGGGFVPVSVAPTFAATNTQVQAFAFGNPNLDAETGETFTAGIVFEPDFLPVGDFKMTADYYEIEITDAIVGRGAQTILTSCYGGLGGTPQSAFDCQQIVRDPATGQVLSVNTTLTNTASPIETSGWDIQLDYEMDLDEVFKGAPGTVGLNTLATLTGEYIFGGNDLAGTTGGGIGGATPHFKTNTTLDYKLDDWLFQVRHNYVPELRQQFFTTEDSPALSNFDASVAWDVSDKLRVVGTVSNVTDDFPPQTAVGQQDQANTDAALYAPWVIGRTFSVQARLKF
jgi:iron complex outermembrane recepter protein